MANLDATHEAEVAGAILAGQGALVQQMTHYLRMFNACNAALREMGVYAFPHYETVTWASGTEVEKEGAFHLPLHTEPARRSLR